jgi:hypothetical protein
MSKPDTIKIDEVEYVRKDSVVNISKQPDSESFPYETMKLYFIRTVTFYYVGRLLFVTPQELVLDQCSWVADTGRFSDALKNGTVNENEPFPDGNVIIGRGSIIDAHIWLGKSLRSQK